MTVDGKRRMCTPAVTSAGPQPPRGRPQAGAPEGLSPHLPPDTRFTGRPRRRSHLPHDLIPTPSGGGTLTAAQKARENLRAAIERGEYKGLVRSIAARHNNNGFFEELVRRRQPRGIRSRRSRGSIPPRAFSSRPSPISVSMGRSSAR